MKEIDCELSTAHRLAFCAVTSLQAAARFAAPESALAKDCTGLATDIEMALTAYHHLWPLAQNSKRT